MARHFTGTHLHRLDGKGRVSLPAGFRRVIEGQGGGDILYVLPGADREEALTVYSEQIYDQVMDAFYDQYPENHPDYEAAAARYVTNAEQIQLDPAGRFVIPRHLRDRLGLDEEVAFVGYGNRFQLWEPRVRAVAQQAAERSAETPPRLVLGRPK